MTIFEFTYTSDSPHQNCGKDIRWSQSLPRDLVEKFTCRECGRTTYGDSYEWRDERLYLNLKKLRLCEECYRFGRNTSQRASDLWGFSQDVSTQRGQLSYEL